MYWEALHCFGRTFERAWANMGGKSVGTHERMILNLRYVLIYPTRRSLTPLCACNACHKRVDAWTQSAEQLHHGIIIASSKFRNPTLRLVETYNSLLTPVLARVCCANFSWTSIKECPRVHALWRGYHWLLPDANLETLLEAMLTVPKTQRAANHLLARFVEILRDVRLTLFVAAIAILSSKGCQLM